MAKQHHDHDDTTKMNRSRHHEHEHHHEHHEHHHEHHQQQEHEQRARASFELDDTTIKSDANNPPSPEGLAGSTLSPRDTTPARGGGLLKCKNSSSVTTTTGCPDTQNGCPDTHPGSRPPSTPFRLFRRGRPDDIVAASFAALEAAASRCSRFFFAATRASSASYSEDGTRIVSASWDGTVRVWDATTC
ncbi:hypothetical protein RI054_34g133060 [Pseudoscourfieldia marina]